MKRNYGIDLLKFISAVAVIAIHVTGQFIRYENITSNPGENLFSFSANASVGIFFVIAGFFYFRSKNRLNSFYKNATVYIGISFTYAVVNFFFFNFVGLEKEFVTTGVLWFMNCLVLLQLTFLIRNERFMVFMILIAILARIGAFETYSIGNNYLSALPFFLSGMVFGKFYKGYTNNTLGLLLVAMGTLGILADGLFLFYTKMGTFMLASTFLVVIGVIFMDPKNFKNRHVYQYSLWLYLTQMFIIPRFIRNEIFQTIYDAFGSYVFIYEAILTAIVVIILCLVRRLLEETKVDPILKSVGL